MYYQLKADPDFPKLYTIPVLSEIPALPITELYPLIPLVLEARKLADYNPGTVTSHIPEPLPAYLPECLLLPSRLVIKILLWREMKAQNLLPRELTERTWFSIGSIEGVLSFTSKFTVGDLHYIDAIAATLGKRIDVSLHTLAD